MSKCKHDPDWEKVQFGHIDRLEQRDRPPFEDEVSAVYDICCKKCGLSGSFVIESDDLDWK